MTSKSTGSLGDRMKAFERAETSRRVLPGTPVCARLDGRNFSNWTRGLARPFDPRLTEVMTHCTLRLVQETDADVGYTQSDEITLIWARPERMFFGGKYQKLASILSSMLTAHFNAKVPERIPELAGIPGTFDCRVWQVPTLEDAADVLLWREADATKNSINSAARAHFSHGELHKKNGDEMREMLRGVGVDWDAYPVHFRRGTYVLVEHVTRSYTMAELAVLPPKHAAHVDPDLEVTRRVVRPAGNIPPLRSIEDRVSVLFGAAT